MAKVRDWWELQGSELLGRVRTAADGAAHEMRGGRDGLGRAGQHQHISADDVEDMAQEALVKLWETGQLGAGSPDLDAAAAKALALSSGQGSVRAAARVERVLGMVGSRSDVSRLDLAAGDIPLLDGSDLCAHAELLTAGAYDPAVLTGPGSVDHARAALVGIAGAETVIAAKRPKGRAVPWSSATPEDYAARLRAGPIVNGFRPGVLQALKLDALTGSGADASALDQWRKGAAKWGAARVGPVRSLASTARLDEGAARLRARVVCSTVAQVLDLLDGGWRSAGEALDLARELRDIDGEAGPVKVSGVSVLSLDPAGPGHVRATVREVVAKGSLTVPRVEVFIRHRDSGHGSSAAEIREVHGADQVLERWEVGAALVGAAHSVRPVKRAKGRGRPALDLLAKLDAVAARCGIVGVGCPCPSGSHLPGECVTSPVRVGVQVGAGVGIGSLSAVDLLTFVSGDDFDAIDAVPGAGKRNEREAGVNLSALADFCAGAGVKLDRRTAGEHLTRWAGQVRAKAGRASVLGGRAPRKLDQRARAIARDEARRGRGGCGTPAGLLTRAGLVEHRRSVAWAGKVRPVRVFGLPVVPPRLTWAAWEASSGLPVEWAGIDWRVCDGAVWDVRPGLGVALLSCGIRGRHFHAVADGLTLRGNRGRGGGLDGWEDGGEHLGAPTQVVRQAKAVYSWEWREALGLGDDYRPARVVRPVRRGGAPTAALVAAAEAWRERRAGEAVAAALRAGAVHSAMLDVVAGRPVSAIVKRGGGVVLSADQVRAMRFGRRAQWDGSVLRSGRPVAVSSAESVPGGGVLVPSSATVCRCGRCSGEVRAALDVLGWWAGSTS